MLKIHQMIILFIILNLLFIFNAIFFHLLKFIIDDYTFLMFFYYNDVFKVFFISLMGLVI